MKLSEEQLKAVEMIDTATQPVRLIGGPGVGKSTVINHLRSRIIKVAPTNKAATLIDGMTVHKLLGLSVKEERGKVITVPTRKTPRAPILQKCVFDESSCIPKDILEKYILPLVPNAIFVGDEAQLNPVGEEKIPFIALDLPTVKLEHVHRFEGELLEVAYDLRKSIFNDEHEFAIPASWQSSEIYDLGENDIIIAWRNDTVNLYNQLIKKHRFGTTDWVVGEHVRIGTHYERLRLLTESEYTIVNVSRDFSTPYEAWKITLSDGSIVPVLHDSEKSKYKHELKKLADAQDWPSFWFLNKMFCDLRPSFAITAHKAQGSTYDNVYVDYFDIFGNNNTNEARRAAYVATTRARYSVRNLVL